MKLKPLNKNVLVEVRKSPNEKKVGSVTLHLATGEDQRLEVATVLAVADDVEKVKKGDVIHFKTYSLSEVKLKEKVYGFLKEEDILAKE